MCRGSCPLRKTERGIAALSDIKPVVVITGASGGIGAATARRLADEVEGLVLVARRPDALAAIAGECGELALPVVADVTERDEVDTVLEQALERFGRVDVWINNVGRGITRVPSEINDADIDEMMRVNVKSAWAGVQAVLPHMRERGTGHLINVSSMLGRIPMVPFRAAYSGAKHFLNALTADLRHELAEPHPGITVSLVSPGLVWTEFGKNALHGGPDSRELQNGQEVAEVAEVIADVIKTRKTDVYTRVGSHDRVVDYYEGIGEDP
jgi:NADP-dependent 3-hydroxy acid dehydrogenase YdfG